MKAEWVNVIGRRVMADVGFSRTLRKNVTLKGVQSSHVKGALNEFNGFKPG